MIVKLFETEITNKTEQEDADELERNELLSALGCDDYGNHVERFRLLSRDYTIMLRQVMPYLQIIKNKSPNAIPQYGLDIDKFLSYIPTPVLRILKQYESSFHKIGIYHNEYNQQNFELNDPFLVGQIGDNDYLLAQWGKEKLIDDIELERLYKSLPQCRICKDHSRHNSQTHASQSKLFSVKKWDTGVLCDNCRIKESRIHNCYVNWS